MKSKLLILLAAGALMLAMAATAAFADNLLCQVGIACNGTPQSDILTGTTNNDQIKVFGGRDRINDNLGSYIDTIAGGAKNDTIDVQEGNSSTNNRDLVDCGKGEKDRVFFDTGSNGDRVVRCEIKNPEPALGAGGDTAGYTVTSTISRRPLRASRRRCGC